MRSDDDLSNDRRLRNLDLRNLRQNSDPSAHELDDIAIDVIVEILQSNAPFPPDGRLKW